MTHTSASPGAHEGWLRVASLAVFLALWQGAASLVDDPVLPAPLAVGQVMFAEIATGELLAHVGVTLRRVAASFVLAMAIGAAIGVAMGRIRVLDLAFDGWLILGLNIPALVVTILCYIWFGLTEVAAVLAVAVNKIPLVAVTVREGARAVDRKLLEVATAFRISRPRTLARVYLPQLYPSLMTSARTGLSLIWKIVLVVELLGRSDGVGFKLGVLFQFFDMTGILAYSLAFVAVVFLVELVLVQPLERRATAWRA